MNEQELQKEAIFSTAIRGDKKERFYILSTAEKKQ